MKHEIKFKIYHNSEGVPIEASLSHDVINPNGTRITVSRTSMSYAEYIAYKEAIEHPIHIDSFGEEM